MIDPKLYRTPEDAKKLADIYRNVLFDEHAAEIAEGMAGLAIYRRALISYGDALRAYKKAGSSLVALMMRFDDEDTRAEAAALQKEIEGIDAEAEAQNPPGAEGTAQPTL